MSIEDDGSGLLPEASEEAAPVGDEVAGVGGAASMEATPAEATDQVHNAAQGMILKS